MAISQGAIPRVSMRFTTGIPGKTGETSAATIEARQFVAAKAEEVGETAQVVAEDKDIVAEDKGLVAIDRAASEQAVLDAEAFTIAAQQAVTNQAVSYDTLSALNADLARSAGTVGQVLSDGANNGFYAKVGTSGTGSWAKKSSATVPGLDQRAASLEGLVAPDPSLPYSIRDILGFILAQMGPTGGFRSPRFDIGFTPDDGFAVKDTLGFTGFRVDATGAYWMGKRLGDAVADASQVFYDHTDVLATGAAQFAKWRVARAKVLSGQGQATVAFVGDSNTMGWNMLGVGNHRRALSHPTMSAKLMGRTLPARAAEFFGASTTWTDAAAYTAYDPRITFGAGWSGDGLGSVGGAAFRNFTNDNPMSVAPGVQWDTVTLITAHVAAASFSLDIGGAATTFSPPAGALQRITYTVPRGANALNIRRLSGAPSIIGGWFTDSTEPSINVLNFGRSGWRSADAAGAANWYNPLPSLSFIAPDLTIIELGLNDANTSVSLADYKTNMQAIIDAAKVSGDVVIASSVLPSRSFAIPWSSYVTAMHELAQVNDLPFVDLTKRFSVRSGFVADDLHPNSTGAADKAFALADYLLTV